MTELDISCLPADLPEFIEVDLSGLKKGMSLHLNDIKLPKGVTAVTHGKPNPVLVSVVTAGGRRSRRRRTQPQPRRPLPRRKPRRRQGRQGWRQGRRCQGRRRRQGSRREEEVISFTARPVNGPLRWAVFFCAALDNPLP